MKKFNEKGEELMDPTPMALPVGYKRPPSIQEQIARYIRQSEMLAKQNGQETFEEADDFDVGDDFDPYSPYEENFDHVQNFEQLKQATRAATQKRKEGGRKGDFQEEEPTQKTPKDKKAQDTT